MTTDRKNDTALQSDKRKKPKPPQSPNAPAHKMKQAPGEINGPDGPEPTRYGDWEKNGICSDF